MIYLLPVLSAFCIFVAISLCKWVAYRATTTPSAEGLDIFCIFIILTSIGISISSMVVFVREFPGILFGPIYLIGLLPFFHKQIAQQLNIKQKLRNYLEIEDKNDETN